MREFSDGVPLGRGWFHEVRDLEPGADISIDPKGNLYFYNLRPDFNQDKVTQYLVSFPQRGSGVKTEIIIVIGFYRPNNKAKPYAKVRAPMLPTLLAKS